MKPQSTYSMRATMFLLMLLTAALVSGCSTDVLDGRTDSEICEIHHTFMGSQEIQCDKHYKAPTQEYLQARKRGFIHSYPYDLPYRKRTKVLVYICEDCVQAEAMWKQQHPGQ